MQLKLISFGGSYFEQDVTLEEQDTCCDGETLISSLTGFGEDGSIVEAFKATLSSFYEKWSDSTPMESLGQKKICSKPVMFTMDESTSLVFDKHTIIEFLKNQYKFSKKRNLMFPVVLTDGSSFKISTNNRQVRETTVSFSSQYKDFATDLLELKKSFSEFNDQLIAIKMMSQYGIDKSLFTDSKLKFLQKHRKKMVDVKERFTTAAPLTYLGKWGKNALTEAITGNLRRNTFSERPKLKFVLLHPPE